MLGERLLIYTDLDGSLLDHHDYSHAAADDMLAQLARMNVPVVFATSKTAAELLAIRKELDNRHPFIIENGAAVYIPGAYFSMYSTGTRIIEGYRVKEFTEPRQHWQSLIEKVHEEFAGCYTTFKQAGVEGIMQMTGLRADEAQRAAQRGYGEPVEWRGSETQKAAFIKRLEALGASVLQGGRFLHVSGACDKGSAMHWLTRQYQANEQGSTFTTVAAGDSQNDVAMLEAADIALIIRSPVNAMPVIDRHQHCFCSSKCGPKGWVEGMNNVLDFVRNSNSIIN